MSLKGDLPDSMEAAALLDAANTGVERLLSALYPERKGLHASDFTDPSQARRFGISTQRKLLSGYFVETKWAAIFAQAGILFRRGDSKTVNWNGRVITYTPDMVVRLDDRDYVVEIKSVGTDVWSEVRRFAGPYRKHFLRTEMYLLLSGIRRGFLIYENRDTCEPWVVPVGPLTPERRESLEAYIQQKSEPFGETDDEDGARE